MNNDNEMLDRADILPSGRSDPSIIAHLKKIEKLLGYEEPVNDNEEES